MTETRPLDPPSPLVERWAAALAERMPASRRALDVAMGRGRHASTLAGHGFRVFGVDRQHDAVRQAVSSAASRGYRIRGWCADLTVTELPKQFFDLVVVTRYLQRTLFPSLVETLAPGGAILYETFTSEQLVFGRGPTSPDHLLRPGELPSYFGTLEMIFYEEVSAPDAVARLVARNRSNRS